MSEILDLQGMDAQLEHSGSTHADQRGLSTLSLLLCDSLGL